MEENYLHGKNTCQARGGYKWILNMKSALLSLTSKKRNPCILLMSTIQGKKENVFKIESQKFKGKIENASGPWTHNMIY